MQTDESAQRKLVVRYECLPLKALSIYNVKHVKYYRMIHEHIQQTCD